VGHVASSRLLQVHLAVSVIRFSDATMLNQKYAAMLEAYVMWSCS